MSDQTFDESVLSAYLDGELTPAERADVERRLADAPDLRESLDEVRSTRDAVRALPAVDAPAGFWDRVLSSDSAPTSESESANGNVVPLAAARSKRARSDQRRRRWLAIPSAAAAAVIVAVVLVPHPTRVSPRLSTLSESHAERSSVENDPVTNLAPVSADPSP